MLSLPTRLVIAGRLNVLSGQLMLFDVDLGFYTFPITIMLLAPDIIEASRKMQSPGPPRRACPHTWTKHKQEQLMLHAMNSTP